MSESELDRILRETFGEDAGKPAPPEGLAGPVDEALQRQEEGHVRQVTYEGSPQTQRGGALGRSARRLAEAWRNAFVGIRRQACPPWLSEDCLELLSRGVEQTFRNFQLTARRPSHVDPPFSARPIDAFTPAPGVAVNLGAFVTAAAFTMPAGRFRGVIAAAGQATAAVGNMAQTEWRIRLDGRPLPPWGSIVGVQLWQIVPPTPLCGPIHLHGGQTVELQVRATVPPVPFAGFGRLCGWFYPVRVESDDNIRSTLVD